MTTLTLEHTDAEGTLLTGTARQDGSAQVVKALGWRWGRGIGAWFLPRSRGAVPKREVIARTVQALQEAGFTVEVEIDARPEDREAAEARRAESAAARAERLHQSAERHRQRAEEVEGAGRALADRIPLGQPILVGHHSQRRAERDAERIRRAMDGAAAHREKADSAQRAGDVAAASIAARHNPVTVANRVRRLEAEIRRDERQLAGAAADAPWVGAIRERLEAARADLAYWEQVRAQQIADGVATNYGRESVRPGDLVKVRGRWVRVVRANAKTVSVETGYSWTDSAPWHEVQDHRRAEES